GPYSSAGSIEDSVTLARNLGISFERVPIGDIFDSYRTALQPMFAGRPQDVTEENIQARIRGSLLMAVSDRSQRYRQWAPVQTKCRGSGPRLQSPQCCRQKNTAPACPPR